MLLKNAALNDEESGCGKRKCLKFPIGQGVHAMWRKTKGETMEAQKCSKATGGKRCHFPAQRATAVFAGVLLMTALAGAGEPAGRDPNNRAIVVVRPADSRDGAAHKHAADVVLGRYDDNTFRWGKVRRVTGLSGIPGMKMAPQDAEAIIGHCQRALALGVKDEEVYWMMGEAYFFQKQYRKAIDAGLGALQIKPDFYPALHLLIRSHSRAGEYERALDYCVSGLAARPGATSDPHVSYFYSLCRRLVAAGRYTTALSYYEKWAQRLSEEEIEKHRRQYTMGCDLAQEKYHAKCYLNNPIKGYPPTITFSGTPRRGLLADEEKQRLMAPLNQIAVSCSSPNITITAVSLEKKGILSHARIARNTAGGLTGEVGALEIEFKGKLKERVYRRDDCDPADLRGEINRTKAEAIKGFLRQAAPHLGIPQYVLTDLYLYEDWALLAYRHELTYQGLPLRLDDLDRPRFTVEWGRPEIRERNAFSVYCSLYPLPNSDIPVKPLVSERQAREMATQALKDKYPDWQERREVPDDSAAKREFTIDEISLCIQPEFLSFGQTIDTDLFDPVCELAEYRLVWIALDRVAPFVVRVDAITGEILAIRYWGPI